MTSYLLNVDRQQSVLQSLGSAPRAYPPYGALHAASGPHLGFCGQRRDALTGLYPMGNGHRFYDPVLMRFLSPDAMSPFGRGGVNAYMYCSADPINRTDPNGRYWQRIVGVVSSFTTALGAFVRAAKNEATRLSHRNHIDQKRPGDPPPYTETPVPTRIGNAAFFYTGVAGVAGAITYGLESDWASPALLSLSTGFGVGNASANTLGGWTSNWQAAMDTFTLSRQHHLSKSQVVVGTAMEVTGIRMTGEAMSYVAQGAWDSVIRLRGALREGVRAWHKPQTSA